MIRQIRLMFGKPFRMITLQIIKDMEWDVNHCTNREKAITKHKRLNRMYDIVSAMGKRIEGYKG